jgi:hypothetical protein
MPIGKQSDFVLQDTQYQLGKYEALGRTVRAFNQASNHALRLVQHELLGQYEKDAFFDLLSGLVSRRDLTSVEDADDLALTQSTEVGVKLDRLIGPVTQTLNSFHKIGLDAAQMSLIVGRMVADAKTANFLDAGLLAAQACLAKQATTQYDATSETTATLTHHHLLAGLAKLGDAAQRITCWVMHSKVYFDLMRQTLTDNLAGVAHLTVRAGSVETLGLPVVVTDSAALLHAGTPNTYSTLGLVRDGLVLTESEDETVAAEMVTGKQQLLFRIQGEYAFNVRVRGFAFSTALANPTDAQLTDSANWTLVAGDIKNAAGIEILTQ